MTRLDPRKRKEIHAEWIRRAATGEYHTAIAKEYKVDRSTVTAVILKNRKQPAPQEPVAATEAVPAPTTAAVVPEITFTGEPVPPAEFRDFSAPLEAPAAPQPAAASSPAPAAPRPAAAPAAVEVMDARPLVDAIFAIVDRVAPLDDAPKVAGPVTEAERQALAKAWGPFLVKHAADFAKYAIEINAIAITVAVFGPRMDHYIDAHRKANARAKENEARKKEPAKPATKAAAPPPPVPEPEANGFQSETNDDAEIDVGARLTASLR